MCVYVRMYIYIYVNRSSFIHLAAVFSQSSYFGSHLSHITAVLLLCPDVSWGCEPDSDLGTQTSALPNTEDLSDAQTEPSHCRGTALLTWLRSSLWLWRPLTLHHVMLHFSHTSAIPGAPQRCVGEGIGLGLVLGNEVSCMGIWEERIRAHLHLVCP